MRRLPMPNGIWTLARLTAEQERELKVAEQAIGDGVLLAYTESTMQPSGLDKDQMRRLDELQKKTGLVVISVKPQQT
jgi:hypothetical protein